MNIETLKEAFPEAKWTEVHPTGMLTSAHKTQGAIIDQVIATKEWFVVFMRNDLDALDDFKTREEAIEAAIKEIATAEIIDEILFEEQNNS